MGKILINVGISIFIAIIFILRLNGLLECFSIGVVWLAYCSCYDIIMCITM